MGRFDALQNLEESQEKNNHPLVISPPVLEQVAKTTKSPEGKKSTKPQNRLPTKDSSSIDILEKPEKYTTHLEPSLIKKIKLHATERDMKDYQVVKKALLLYFEKVD